jgi:hypothetical protein
MKLDVGVKVKIKGEPRKPLLGTITSRDERRGPGWWFVEWDDPEAVKDDNWALDESFLDRTHIVTADNGLLRAIRKAKEDEGTKDSQDEDRT